VRCQTDRIAVCRSSITAEAVIGFVVTTGGGGRSVHQMARTVSIVCILLLALASLDAGLTIGASAVTHPKRRTAVVSGYVQLCGGPAPGRCWKGEIGFCQASNGCVTSDRVTAVNASRDRVATHKLRHGRFTLRLVPGRYTIELLGDGKRVHARVMQQKRVWARAHRTTTVRFFFAVP
jgi:hypothetical protein